MIHEVERKLRFRRSVLSYLSLLESLNHSQLVLPSLIPQLSHTSKVTQWVIVEALLKEELVGLALAEIYPFLRSAVIKSLVIKTNYRCQGIGRQLFAFMEKLLVEEEKIQIIEIVYEQSEPFTPALEKIMNSLGWFLPKVSVIRCHVDATTFDPPWIYHSYHLPPSMIFFPWKELTIKDRNEIKFLGEQGRFLPYLSPLLEESTIDLDTSVGLRDKEKIVGWCLTRRPDPSTIRYASLYIDNSFLQKGYGIQLLVESILLQKQSLVPKALFEINIKEIDPSWWLFVKKRLFPISNKIEKIKKAIRVFSTNIS